MGNEEKKQVELVETWNKEHKPGIDVIIRRGDETETRTKTRSVAYMLGSNRDYPGHTAVIMLEGVSGGYNLARVTPV